MTHWHSYHIFYSYLFICLFVFFVAFHVAQYFYIPSLCYCSLIIYVIRYMLLLFANMLQCYNLSSFLFFLYLFSFIFANIFCLKFVSFYVSLWDEARLCAYTSVIVMVNHCNCRTPLFDIFTYYIKKKMWYDCQWDSYPQKTKMTQTLTTIGHRTAFNNEQSPYRIVSYKRPR